MKKKDIFAQILALLGTLAVWIPLVMVVGVSLLLLVKAGIFRFDWLLPAELFPAVVVGGGLLLWAARRARKPLKFIAWGWGTAIGVLVAGTVVSIVSGFASARVEPIGFWWWVLVVLFLLYDLANIQLGIEGLRLLRALYPGRKEKGDPKTAADGDVE